MFRSGQSQERKLENALRIRNKLQGRKWISSTVVQRCSSSAGGLAELVRANHALEDELGNIRRAHDYLRRRAFYEAAHA
jgi:hypothetical protein